MNVDQFRKEIYSFSKLATASKCLRKYWYRYVIGRREHVPAQVVGRAIHIGQEFDNLGKLKGAVYPLREVLDAAVDGFRTEAAREALALPIDPFVQEHKKQLEIFQESGQRGLVQPLPGSVEAPFEIPVEVDGEAAQIDGFVDVVSQVGDQPKEVIDYKSGKKPFSQYEVDASLQFQLYCAGAQASGAKAVNFVMAGKQRPNVKTTRPALATEKRQLKLWTWIGDTIRDIRRCKKEDHWPKCWPELFYCPVCDFQSLCYGNNAEDVRKIITIGEVRPVGTVPQPEWRKKK